MGSDPDDDGRRPGGRDPAPGDFEEIVAGWRAEGAVPAWPDDGRVPPPPAPPQADPPAVEEPGPVAAQWRPHTVGPADEDEHFVPPEPPPLPRLGPPALVGLGLLTLGVVLLVSPSWVGVGPVYAVPLGLLGLASGLGWLVLRLWPDQPSERGGDDDDGAVL